MRLACRLGGHSQQRHQQQLQALEAKLDSQVHSHALVITVLIIITSIVIVVIKRFPAHDELGMCEASLVPPKQSVLSILVRYRYRLGATGGGGDP